jgi:hypothetical protein
MATGSGGRPPVRLQKQHRHELSPWLHEPRQHGQREASSKARVS